MDKSMVDKSMGKCTIQYILGFVSKAMRFGPPEWQRGQKAVLEALLDPQPVASRLPK